MKNSNVAAVLALVAAVCTTAFAQGVQAPTQLSRFSSATCGGAPESILNSKASSCNTLSCVQEAANMYKNVACPTSLSAPVVDKSWGLYSAVNVYYDGYCTQPAAFAAVKDGSCRNVGTVDMGEALVKFSATSDCSLGVPSTTVCVGTEDCGVTGACKYFNVTSCEPFVVSGSVYFARVECINWHLKATQRQRYPGNQCSASPTSIYMTQDDPACKEQACKAVSGGYETVTCADDFATPAIKSSWGVYGTASVYSDGLCKTPAAYAAVLQGNCYYSNLNN